MTVAVPAGALIWVLAHLTVSGRPLLTVLADLLQPLGGLMGLDGMVLITLTVIDMFGGGTAPVENGGLTRPAGYLVCGAYLVVIGVTYWIKQRSDKRMLGNG